MNCKRCFSGKQKDFGAEMAIHFPGWEGLNIPHVWAFPNLLVCLDCGFVEFELPPMQLAQLKELCAVVTSRSSGLSEEPRSA
jgi:hypothetical protein